MNAIEYTDRKRKVIQLMQKEFAAIPFQILDEKDWKRNAELVLPNDEDLFKKLEIQPTNEVWQNIIYMCDDFYIDSEYCNVDKLYELGFVPIYYREYYFLIIQGIGYDVIDEHFTPLFEYLNWLR